MHDYEIHVREIMDTCTSIMFFLWRGRLYLYSLVQLYLIYHMAVLKAGVLRFCPFIDNVVKFVKHCEFLSLFFVIAPSFKFHSKRFDSLRYKNVPVRPRG